MNRKLSDKMIDARLIEFLDRRAEEGAARARTPEQVAARMAPRLQPRDRVIQGVPRVLRVAWLAVVAALLLALLTWFVAGGRLPSVLPLHVVRIAIELPLDGSGHDAAQIVDGINLALKDAGGRAGNFRIEIPRSSILSDLVGGQPDAGQGAENMRQIITDPDVVAVIGPYHSFVAYRQLPLSSAAGLLQCSPGNTDPLLTATADQIQGEASPDPGPANYVRVVTTDDVVAVGAARYVFQRLGKTSVLVVDDQSNYGIASAGSFEAEFTRLGGDVVSRDTFSNSGVAIPAILDHARTVNPQAIYFGGAAEQGAMLLVAAGTSGLGEIPFLGTEALNDGSAATQRSFLNLVGDGARNAYSVFPGFAGGSGKAEFETRFRASYGDDPPPFASFGYACVQVVLAALRQVDANPPAATTGLRDAVRAAGVDPNATFETVLGPITFDAAGDITQKVVTVYDYDAVAHAWVAADQIDAAAGIGR